jgi:hypothetical protein
MKERMSEDLNDTLNTISTATALGMEVPAPQGTHFYEAIGRQPNPDWDEEENVFVSGFHPTRESAINELLQTAIDIWKEDEAVAPWTDSFTLEQEQLPQNDWQDLVDSSFRDWLKNKTDEEILNSFYGLGRWNVTVCKVAKPVPYPTDLHRS